MLLMSGQHAAEREAAQTSSDAATRRLDERSPRTTRAAGLRTGLWAEVFGWPDGLTSAGYTVSGPVVSAGSGCVRGWLIDRRGL